MQTITKADVIEAAKSAGIEVLEALSQMQAVCASRGYEDTLEQLCEIKSELIFGRVSEGKK